MSRLSSGLIKTNASKGADDFYPEDTLSLDYNSNFNKKGFIRIFSPWRENNEPKVTLKKDLTVKVDGKDTNFWLDRKNEDLYIAIETDFKRHTLEISRIKKSPSKRGIL